MKEGRERGGWSAEMGKREGRGGWSEEMGETLGEVGGLKRW